MRFYRCPLCQTAVWSHYGGRTALAFLRVGALDDPSWLPPDVHIYVRSKLPWIALPPGVPAFPAYYELENPLAVGQPRKAKGAVWVE